MRKLIAILILALVAYINWGDRKNRTEALKEDITEFNEKQTDINQLSIYPLEMSYTETDSLLSNGFKVKIRNFSTDDVSDFIKVETNSKPKKITYHRQFTSEIEIAFNQEPLLHLNLNAKTFEAIDPSNFWKSATLQHAWLDEDESMGKRLNFKVSFLNPVTKHSRFYEIWIDQKGEQEIHLIEKNIG